MTEHENDEILDEEREDGGRVGATIKTVIVSVVIVVLALGVLYLLSERNARRYFLVAEEGQLLVQRGIFFPVGERRFTPEEPELEEAYRPIPIPAGEDVEQRRTFDERTELDRVLVDQLLSWSRERIDPEQPDRLEQGIYYLRRTEGLPTTTAAQREEIDVLRGEVAYHEGRRFIESALRSLDTARERLTQARDSPAGWGRESRQLLRAIQEPEDALRRALREGEVRPDPEPDPDAEPTEVDEEEPEVDPDAEIDPDADADAEEEGEAGDGELRQGANEPRPEQGRLRPVRRQTEVRPAAAPSRDRPAPVRPRRSRLGKEAAEEREAAADDGASGSLPLQGIAPPPSGEGAEEAGASAP